MQVLRSGVKVGAGQVMDESATESAKDRDAEDGTDTPGAAAEAASGSEREAAVDSFVASMLQQASLNETVEEGLPGGKQTIQLVQSETNPAGEDRQACTLWLCLS